MSKPNCTVIRNDACPSSQVSIREGHNERRSKTPLNADIMPERTELNVHFHQNFKPDGTLETYHDTINRLLDERKIVKHNFKPKSAIVDEFILDVNSEYFEENGGYDFAKKFYEEAYRYAIKEAGSEDYIVSAILHADERHKVLSERYGHDVYHYHLHVVYVPVVQKEIKWTKRAGPDLVGKVKSVIPQINHTDKWPRKKMDGKFINEYSKLQDRYYEHMIAAGFPDLQRGERGSAAEHLTAEEYKYQQEKKRVAELKQQADVLRKKVDNLVEATKVRADVAATQSDIDKMARPGKSGNNKIVSNADWKTVSDMAKRCTLLDVMIPDLQSQIKTLQQDRDKWKDNYTRLWNEVKDFIDVIRKFPQRLLQFISENFKQKPHNREDISK